MKFGVPWGVTGIRPEARETAKEAARRSGMSLGDWLNSVILQQAQRDGIDPRAQGGERSEVANLHQRLDDLTRRIEQITRAGPAAYGPRRRSSDAEQLLSPPLAPYLPQPLPNVRPDLDHAVAEVSARRRALNGESVPIPGLQMPVSGPASTAPRAPPAAAATPATPAAPMHPMLPTQNLSGLEEQLRRITDQIETLRKPGVEEAISALRRELSEIGRALADALPRRAIEAIEKQIREVAKRVDDGRQAGVDQRALARIEQGLGEVRDALRGLTPAESLVGFNEAVVNLAHKIDLIVAQKDPATLEQLNHTVTTLRGLAEHVASNEAVTQLANEVLLLGEKIDYIAQRTGGSDALNTLDHRVAAIADAVAERAQSGGSVPPQLEALIQSLSDKIEQMRSSPSESLAISHLESSIVSLVEKLDASQSQLGQLEAIERGLGDLLTHMKEMRASNAAEPAQATAVVDLKQNMARTQDALEAVHGALGHVVDRLAMIEKEFRSTARERASDEREVAAAPAVVELAARAVNSPETGPPASPTTTVQAPPAPPGAEPVLAPPLPPRAPEPPPQAQAMPRRRIATSLPANLEPSADQPIEPGSGPPKFSARIAASEAALGGVGAVEIPAGGKSNFIAAARRAAQAAMQQGAAAPGAPRAESMVLDLDDEHRPSLRARIMQRVKSVFIAASIIAVVVGGFQIAGNWLNFAEAPKNNIEKAGKVELDKLGPAAPLEEEPSRSDTPQQPSTVPPPAKPAETPLSGLNGTPAAPSLLDPPVASAPPVPSAAPKATPPAKNDVTGSLPDGAQQEPASADEPSPDKGRLPVAIGSTRLRSAALAGDAGAAYEVAVRFAEGRGVPVNLPDAAFWFARAASRGLAPAQFRYASMLEKGQGVKKEQARARDLYLAAAAKGNAKAMHNLAVLYAEGIDGKPDYSAAVKWFRLAARHGIADSQYNLGVLTARGVGTEKDFAASYKWFALAAAQGDQESARKRDEVASHLDAPALAAAQQTVATFVIEPQPKTATAVPKPQGGWDDGTSSPTTKNKSEVQPPAPQNAPLSLGSFTLGKR